MVSDIITAVNRARYFTDQFEVINLLRNVRAVGIFLQITATEEAGRSL